MENDLSEQIRNRESWLKLIIIGITFFSIILLFTIIIYNIVIGNIKFNFTDLRFTDLLSLIMAIFAISLSILFYLKATETSNTFYDNTYRFTTNVSQILGRIESGFEARLRHIDEGQSYLREKVDRIPYANPESTRKEISEEQKELDAKLKEKNELIKELVEKSELQAHEKTDFLRLLDEKEKSIADLRIQLSHLSRQLTREQHLHEGTPKRNLSQIQSDMHFHIVNKIFGQLDIDHELSKTIDIPDVKNRFEGNLFLFNQQFVSDMKKLGYIDKNDKLTQRGINFLVTAFNEYKK